MIRPTLAEGRSVEVDRRITWDGETWIAIAVCPACLSKLVDLSTHRSNTPWESKTLYAWLREVATLKEAA